MEPARDPLRLLIQGDNEADYLAKCHEALRTGLRLACDARSFGRGYPLWKEGMRTFPEIARHVFPQAPPQAVFASHEIAPQATRRLEFDSLECLDAKRVLLLGDFWNVTGSGRDEYLRFLEQSRIDLVLCYFPQPLRLLGGDSSTRFVHCLPCFDPDIFHSWDIPKQWDVGFLAAGTTDPSPWYPERRALHLRFLEQPGWRYLWAEHPGWERTHESRPLVGEEFSRAIGSCRIFVTTCGTFRTPNPKYVEILASGAMLAAEEPEGAQSLGLIDGVNYVRITPESAVERIQWHLDHPSEMERIARAGFELAHARHAHWIRGREVVQWIRETPTRPTPSPTATEPGAIDRGQGDAMDPMTLLRRNLEVLAHAQPREAERILQAASQKPAEIRNAASGHPVPVVRGVAMHDLADPMKEGRIQAEEILGTNASQRRLVVGGFGFGYHLLPLLEKGFCPIVWEPSAALLAQAFQIMDWTEELPFLTIVTGSVGPDLPRESRIWSLPAWDRVEPAARSRLGQLALASTGGSGISRGDGIFLSSYRNITCLKNPHDLVIYQMLLQLVRPTLVLEIGAYRGGSAVWIADQLATMGGDRRVHTYGIENEFSQTVLDHPLVHTHLGGHDAFDPAIVRPGDRTLVIEDSSHTYANTLAVLRKFAPYVSPNSYFIVEDGHAHEDHPEMGLEGGPLRATLEFLREQDQLVEDPWWENLFGTDTSNCLHGVLRRRA